MPRVTPNPPVKLAVMLSGRGRTLAHLLDLIARRYLSASVEVVISSRAKSGGVELARQHHIPYEIVRPVDKTPEEYSVHVGTELAKHTFDLVCMAGWNHFWHVPADLTNRVMNIHPALLPSFGGAGMFGLKVHQTVLESGVKLSGCTVHFADNAYDMGPIIVQRACPVWESDTPETLRDRVFEQEKIAYPAAIRLFAQGRLTVEGRRVRIAPDTSQTRNEIVPDDAD